LAILRFPNPGSDFHKLVETFCVIYSAQDAAIPFDLDSAVRALIDARQVSSQGAVGEEALKRSTRPDRSRDPLYNQLKMYSELYRMLGWLHPVSKRLIFQTTPLSDYICKGASRPLPARTAALVRECLLGICFPNPNTENKGIDHMRPFPFLLKLMGELDGLITRHEMILGLLATTDDLSSKSLPAAVKRIKAVRGNRIRLLKEVGKIVGGIQVNTAENYTRFPVGVLEDPIVKWATSEMHPDLYDVPVRVLRLTSTGLEQLDWLEKTADVREHELESFGAKERAHFSFAMAYRMVERAGHNIGPVLKLVQNAEKKAKAIFGSLGVSSGDSVLYSPFQQAEHSILKLAMAIDESS
jgi:hypothetical protein